MATDAALMTAEEYAALPDSFDGPTELVKGVLVTMAPPFPRHGQICSQILFLLRVYLETHPIGHVLCNDSSIVTERDPDTVRGADIAFYSYQRVPKGPLPAALLKVAPELVFEVRSPDQRWSELHVKVGEYLNAGVQVACVVDDDTRTVHAFFADRGTQVFAALDEFSLPDVLGDFRVLVKRFFE